MYIHKIFFFPLVNRYMRVTSQYVFLTHTSCIVKDLTDLSYNVTANDCPSTRRNLDFQADRQSKSREHRSLYIYICTRRATYSRKCSDSVSDLANSTGQLRGSFLLFFTIWKRGKSLMKLLLQATLPPLRTNT